MIAVKDKIWFLREGLFAKYVMSLVGLVVFVLAVNGATETWISYRATKTTLIDAMSEKAEATARRIEQSISELERQISWVTRASAKTYSGVVTLEDHHADYVQLLNQVPAVNQLTLLDGNGREQRGNRESPRHTAHVQCGKCGLRECDFRCQHGVVCSGLAALSCLYDPQRRMDVTSASSPGARCCS